MGKSTLAGQGTNEVLALFARNQGEARQRYRLFMADGVAMGKQADLTRTGRRSGDLQGTYDDRSLGGADYIERLGAGRNWRGGLRQALNPLGASSAPYIEMNVVGEIVL